MANTIKKGSGNNDIEITDIDSDFIWSEIWSAGVFLESMQFSPNAVNDLCVIREDSGDSPVIFRVKCSDDKDDRSKKFTRRLYKPKFTFSEGTYSAGSTILITLSQDNP
jgi:hypothetical protein